MEQHWIFLLCMNKNTNTENVTKKEVRPSHRFHLKKYLNLHKKNQGTIKDVQYSLCALGFDVFNDGCECLLLLL